MSKNDKVGSLTRALVGVPQNCQGLVLDLLHRVSTGQHPSGWARYISSILNRELPESYKRRQRLGDIIGEIVSDSARTVKSDAERFVKVHHFTPPQGVRIGEALVQARLATEEEVARALAQQFDTTYVTNVDLDEISAETWALIPPDVVIKYRILPFSKADGILTVALHDPLDLESLDNLRFRLNCDLRYVVASKNNINLWVYKLKAASPKDEAA